MNKTFNSVICATALAFASSACMAQDIVDQWRYTIDKPSGEWETTQFDDSKWTQANGGFGTRSTNAARVSTVWDSNDIWIRKSFKLSDMPAKPALLMFYDEDSEVFINGELITKVEGYSTEYKTIELPADKVSALKVGENVLAIHCHQTTGGQFIDAHVIDATNVPDLPRAKRNPKPFESDLITKWGEKVTPENVWTQYPRPALARENWMNLNGNWDYAVTEDDVNKTPQQWVGKILVPFCLESKLGGVQRLLEPNEALWYHRNFEAKKSVAMRQLLNFEAVDYQCEIFVNRKSVGSHQGGNTPFTLDITDAIKDGDNELVVRVQDDTEGWQLRGKQVLYAQGIFYTQVSGIWQTVWLEQVPKNYLEDLKISTNATDGTITIKPIVQGAGKVNVTIKDGEKVVAELKDVGSESVATIQNVKLWSPDSPFLYDIEATLVSADGKTSDLVKSYAGIRTVGKTKDAEGNLRFTLNGKPIFHWGPLDQGWWPDGLLTPPSDEAMNFDIDWLKQAGFNMIRKHIKVEPRRYYYHCDQVGMMVWQDQVSGGKNPPWTFLKPNPVDATWPEVEHKQFMLELDRMISELENHPSIVVWTPFNEAWGQHQTVEVGKWIAQRDPSRLVNIASGGNFWSEGDVADSHAYPNPGFPFELDKDGRFDNFIKVVGEFGGHGLAVENHLWDPKKGNWGYGGLPKTEAEYKDRYQTSLKILNGLRQKGIAAGVYTQTTDVEGEVNGLMTYDRKVIKIPAEELAKLHSLLFE